MRNSTIVARLILSAVLAASLSGCGHSSPTKPRAQKSIAGCTVPTDWVPKLILRDMVTEGFHAEHAVKDPKALAILNSLFANGHPASNVNFDQWYGEYQDDTDITVRGMTMFNWEQFFTEIVFPRQADVYPAICGGWTFESYLHQHPDVNKAYVDAKLPDSSD